MPPFAVGAMAAAGIGADQMAALLRSEFGHPCAVHYDLRKNMCVYFCLDCQGLNEEAICFHCHVDNTSHRILQVLLFATFVKKIHYSAVVCTHSHRRSLNK